MLVLCLGVVKFHHWVDKQSYQLQLDHDVFLMNVLVDKLEEKDRRIARLRQFIYDHYETEKQENETRIPNAGEEFRPREE